jgi:TonB family protein
MDNLHKSKLMDKYTLTFLILLATLTFSCNNQTSENRDSVTVDTTTVYVNDNNVAEDTAQNSGQRNSFLEPSSTVTSFATTRTEEKISVSDIYKYFDKVPQIFLLPTNKDTTIICKEGTSIKFSANSFVAENTGKEPTDKIKISVKEYNKLSDIILANLSTTSNKDILETGGMVYISATSNNESFVLKKGQEIEIGFPYSKKKDNMQLFSGQWTDIKIDWKPIETKTKDKPPIQFSQSIFTIVEEIPTFPGGKKELANYINQNAKYPFSAIDKKVEGTVYVGFVIDEFGNVTNVSILRGANPALDKVAYYLVSKMPKWKSGKLRNNPVPVQYNLPIKFSLKGIDRTEKTIAEAKEFEDKIKNVTVVYGNTGFNTNDKNFKEEFENNKSDSTIKSTDISEINRYLFSTSQLGWINCDRFYRDTRPKIEYFVQNSETEETFIKVVFHSVKSIMSGYPNSGRFSFANVPLGEKITIVAFRTNNDKVLLAIKETTTIKTGETDLKFEPVTMTKLKTEMEKLNNIN